MPMRGRMGVTSAPSPPVPFEGVAMFLRYIHLFCYDLWFLYLRLG